VQIEPGLVRASLCGVY